MEGGGARGLAPRAVPIAAGLYLVAAWSTVLAVDVANVAGTRDALERRLDVPHLWTHLFRQGNPTELLQWLLIGTTMVLACLMAGWLAAHGRRGAAMFWLLFGITAALMLIEDAGDPRLRIADYGESLLGIPPMLTELLFYGAVSAIPAYAVLRYWRHPWAVPECRRYLVAGVACYAVVVIASGTRMVGGWYDRAGTFVHESLLGGRLLPFSFLGEGTGYWLMDWLMEESLELLGASLLCAAALSYAQATLRRDGEPRAPAPDRGHGDRAAGVDSPV